MAESLPLAPLSLPLSAPLPAEWQLRRVVERDHTWATGRVPTPRILGVTLGQQPQAQLAVLASMLREAQAQAQAESVPAYIGKQHVVLLYFGSA